MTKAGQQRAAKARGTINGISIIFGPRRVSE
eukprot:CAMPEP_0201523896 /NCGR_PEP_ID=MMETSP0161_2-20130828/20988_1 /ASSEMBLY_ACC=CAM_ASM_000251 /TAXON_ID=180227 /ORGANISM="Neoparamoeba aestuarina, Strain SoJaBio B1-5/56/2" /LENGTH=30 /DNA_ID= /DNA_START= /DNA_END= /DNA_ORIENTATION=